jgi:hypothetical protein
MQDFKDSLKRILPDAVVNHIRNEKDLLCRLPQDLNALTDPVRQETIKKISKYKNAHKGERCFVIGNGPSLKHTDLTKLRNEFTFGLNRIYLMFEALGFSTSFFVSINDLVIEQSASEIQALKMPKFVSWRSRKWLAPQEDLYFLYTTYSGPKFARNAAGRLWEGATVTYVALQLAYFFGFSEVVLIGVDHSFATAGKPNTTITSQGDDPNHFDPKYFGKGFRWQLPDLETSEIAYAMARRAFESDGRKVEDATIGGKLNVFPKVEYDSLF